MPTDGRVAATKGALAGVRVLDFTWVRAGPWCTRWLGALGAEVIKVEWPESPNTRRSGMAITTVYTTPDGLPVNLNTSGHFSDTNANKRSITIDTRTERGIDLIRRLVTVSDIVVENFAYGVLERWGLSYENMKKLRPDIIYLSMSGFGHTGRDREYKTMGPVAQALSGLTHLSGLPGKPPAGLWVVVLGRYGRHVWCYICPDRPASPQRHRPGTARRQIPMDQRSGAQRPCVPGHPGQRAYNNSRGLPAG